ncbi:MAG TPA: acetoin utilization protein AcuC [Actinomycetota bacterium]|jgi:acetoin utilization protein AcuC|nr:acetoin utilization protein AcuC [Actinomycetota bacterium]
MTGAVTVVWDEGLLAYDFGPEHPLRPGRAALTMALAREAGLLERTKVITPMALSGGDLARVHDLDYLAAVQAASESGLPVLDYGLAPGDNPPFPGMHEAATLVCGATVAAAAAVLAGDALHAFSPAGGLHHAMPSQASGFCIYNDPAVAIAWMLEQGVERVAYVDVDVHHGDGVEAVFAKEPRVLTISVHESGRFLFPGTGFAHEIGEGAALGTIANLPLPPSTTDDLYLPAFDAIVPQLVRAFEPDVLVTQLGCDSHYTDPLAHLGLTTRAYAELAGRLHDLAHTVTKGRWLATGGGGYQWASVVPRAWCSYLAEMLGTGLPERLPDGFLTEASERYGVTLDPRTADEVVALRSEHRQRVESQVARSIEMLRANLFPLHGLSV